MVLHHITEGTGLIIVATSFFNSQLFSKGNLYIVNIITIPDIFKKKIGKANGKNTLNHFFAVREKLRMSPVQSMVATRLEPP